MPKPTRIEPRHDADGRQIDIDPPSGGSWIREADGGLTPADKATATGAGLAWGADLALEQLGVDPEPNDPLANTAADAAAAAPAPRGKRA
jgi:hypothetical protein